MFSNLILSWLEILLMIDQMMNDFHVNIVMLKSVEMIGHLIQ